MTSHLTSIDELEVQAFTSVSSRIGVHAAADPDGVAVAGPAGSLSYAELSHRASRLAGRLRAAGVGRGSCVGVFLERSPEFVVAACGVLRAGAAYLPIDTASPPDRVEFVLADAGASTVLTSARQQPRLPAGRWSPLLVDEPGSGADDLSAIPHPAGPEALAYVIYTSGSTGQPEGRRDHPREPGEPRRLAPGGVRRHAGRPRQPGRRPRASTPRCGRSGRTSPPARASTSPTTLTRRSPQGLRDWLVAERITIGFVPTVLAEQ